MKLFRMTSLMMMCLVISIPFVFAQELSIQKFQGQDDARGFARVQDEVTIEVLVQIPGENIIEKEQIRLYVGDSYTHFDSCVAGDAGFYTCTLSEPEFEAYQPITFTIELRDDDGNIVGSETKTLVIDNTAPVIKELNVDPPISGGLVTISYIAEDYALTFGDASECSGFKTIEIKADGQVLATDTGSEGDCTKNNVFDVTIVDEGVQQVCAVATDLLNFESAPRCVAVTIDQEPPVIEDLFIFDQQDFILTHVHQGEDRIATINVEITDDGEVDRSQVFAKFNQLNPNLPDFIPPDLVVGDIYSWQNIPVSEVSPCRITVKAKDTMGNEESGEFNCEIKADDTAPTVTGIIPEAVRDSKPLYGYGTQLIIDFEDKDNAGNQGIGMGSARAYLDMRDLDMGGFVQADMCLHESGSKWRCAWLLNPPLSVAEGDHHVILSDGTGDDLENLIGSSQTFDIVYDETGPRPPQIVDFTIVTGQAGIEYQGGAVRGDFVQYTVQSANFVTAFANFAGIGGSSETLATNCEDVGDARNCVFEGLVDLSGPYTANLSFDFYDDALNNASTSTTLQVYGIDNETNANYWQSPPDVTCSPRLIDRKTAALIPPFATCRVDLETPRGDITTLAVAGPSSPSECVGDVDLNLNDIYVINNAEGSTHPYLFMTLEPKNYYVDELKIECPLQVFSKRAVISGGETQYYVSPTAQELPVNFTLQFYNQPLGDIDENIEERIRDALDDTLADQEWITTLREFLRYGEMICYAKQLITNIIGVFYPIILLLGGNPYTEGAKVTICNVEENIAESYKVSLDFLSPVCDIANCAATTGKMDWLPEEAAYIGGGIPFCKTATDFFNQLDLDRQIFGAAVDESGNIPQTGLPLSGVTVKDSLILSTACLCLPGIIYNLDKLRQVRCFEAVCLNDYVKQDGYPVSFCDEMGDYFMCAYVIGEIFSLLPFTAFFDELINMVVTMLSDPLSLFTTALGFACMATCPVYGGYAFAGCALLKTVSVIGESIGAVNAYRESTGMFSDVGNQYCDRMEEIKDEFDGEGI